jgi:hypothetical protein
MFSLSNPSFVNYYVARRLSFVVRKPRRRRANSERRIANDIPQSISGICANIALACERIEGF